MLDCRAGSDANSGDAGVGAPMAINPSAYGLDGQLRLLFLWPPPSPSVMIYQRGHVMLLMMRTFFGPTSSCSREDMGALVTVA